MSSSEPKKDLFASLEKFNDFINTFRSVRRTVWYKGLRGPDDPERDGEHAYHVLMLALFINQFEKLEYDTEKLMWYAIVHDLPEAYAGDTPAIITSGDNMQSSHTHDTKAQREADALRRIDLEWSTDFPEMVRYIHAYERQEDPESVFIYTLDKLAGVMNDCHDDLRSTKLIGCGHEELDAYKRPRIEKHPLILSLYESYLAYMKQHPHFCKA